LIPVLIWNLIFANKLPIAFTEEEFNSSIPHWLLYAENILRLFVFLLPVFMILSFRTKQQKLGLGVYLFGVSIYCLSWFVVMSYPESDWSTSLLGFTAPAYTTIFFFIGITLIGKKSFLNISHPSIIYILLSILFVSVHTAHVFLVFQRLYG
jgi:hypothetical protein